MKTKLFIDFAKRTSCLFLAFAIALTGCTSVKSWFDESELFESELSIQDIGAVHVAVLTVAPFEKYREAVQPQFKLSPDEALLQVLPSTQATEERIVDSLNLKLQAAAKMSLNTETKTEPSTSQSKAGERTAASLPVGASESLKDITLGQNPLLKYWTAVALYQEVQLLNRYIQDAAIPETYKPFVIRLQITLLPWARNKPYDAYADISFFNQTLNKEISVLPLLVTDDVEAAIVASSVDRARQLAFALSAGVKNVDLSSNIDSLYEQLESISGRDYNSAFTVARVSQNTLRARFGALNQGKKRYSMIPQTHNVTLLLMVPIDLSNNLDTEVKLVSRTTFLNTKTGKGLKDKSKVLIKENLDNIFEKQGINPNTNTIQRDALQEFIENNDYYGFKRYLDKNIEKQKERVDAQSLWVDMAQDRDIRRYQTAILVLPKTPDKILANKEQTIMLLDDEKTGISTILVGFKGFNSKNLQVEFMAPLRSVDKDGKVLQTACDNLNQDWKSPTGCDEVTLTAESIKSGLTDDQFMVTFPSLAAIKREPAKNGVRVKVVSIDKNGEYKGYYAVKKTSLPFEISIRERVINSDKQGQGKLAINITKAPKDGVTLNLVGAAFDIQNVTTDPPNSLSGDEKKKGILKLKNGALVTIQLFNLSPESYVTVYGADETGASSTPIILKVQSLSGKEKE